MGKRTLLLITRAASLGISQTEYMLHKAAAVTQERLYVALHQNIISSFNNDSNKLLQFVQSLYTGAFRQHADLDVRILLWNMKLKSESSGFVESKGKSCDQLLVDYKYDGMLNGKQAMPILDGVNFTTNDLYLNKTFFVPSEGCKARLPQVGAYAGTVLGGTFDRLHIGHKILLSSAVLMSEKQLTCGVTDGQMILGKALNILIEPVEKRISEVLDFVRDVDPSLSCKVVPILDPYGPSIVDTNLDAIVASEETLKGALSVNQKRRDAKLNELDVFIICLSNDHDDKDLLAHKISSSDARLRYAIEKRRDIFGSLLKPGKSGTPKIIGLTGGIASGKSHISAHLGTKGVSIIDCDLLGHQAYLPGTKAFQQICSHFGSDIVDETTKRIDRKKLGSIVFKDKSQMNKLNEIVWPAIAEMVQAQIKQLAENGVKVVVLDAAVLIEAGWQSLCDEVWVCVIPVEEAVKRIQDRNKLTKEQAVQRISHQMCDENRLKHANVAFCSLWDYPVTRAQVDKAYDELINRL